MSQARRKRSATKLYRRNKIRKYPFGGPRNGFLAKQALALIARKADLRGPPVSSM
jgi:hypothetical protein